MTYDTQAARRIAACDSPNFVRQELKAACNEIDSLRAALADATRWRDEYREKALSGQDALNAMAVRVMSKYGEVP